MMKMKPKLIKLFLFPYFLIKIPIVLVYGTLIYLINILDQKEKRKCKTRLKEDDIDEAKTL